MGIQDQALADVLDAVSSIQTGIDRLLEAAENSDLAALGPDNLIVAMRALETQRNRFGSVDHAIVEAIEMESLWEQTTASTAAGALAQILRLSTGEAKARVRAAGWFGPRLTLDGQELPPALPAAAAAQRAGELSDAQASVIGRCMDELAKNPQISLDEMEAAERYLVENSATFGPRSLQRLAVKMVDVLIPDGTPPKEHVVNARRGLTIGPQREDGTSSISGVLTPDVRAQLWAVLSPLAAPHKSESGEMDTRSAPQRMHDALGAACARLLSSGGLPSSGGVPATVVVTITMEQIQAAAALLGSEAGQWDGSEPSFTTVDGMRLSLSQFLRLADEAEVIPSYLNAAGGVMGYGRIRRTASPSQMRALIARDRGCTFPDCEAPPQWCQAHHVVPWLVGGKTDLSNLALVCKHHHRHFEQRGWDCVMIDGVPQWIPPIWIDPERRPITKIRIDDQPVPIPSESRTSESKAPVPKPPDPPRPEPTRSSVIERALAEMDLNEPWTVEAPDETVIFSLELQLSHAA